MLSLELHRCFPHIFCSVLLAYAPTVALWFAACLAVVCVCVFCCMPLSVVTAAIAWHLAVYISLLAPECNPLVMPVSGLQIFLIKPKQPNWYPDQ